MAFKPLQIEKEIRGTKFVAQFTGVSALYDFNDETQGKLRKQAEYLFKNVIVQPRIDDIDEFFGTNIDYQNEVLEFAGKVLRADKEFFPDKK